MQEDIKIYFKLMLFLIILTFSSFNSKGEDFDIDESLVNLTAKNVICVNDESGVIVYEKEAHTQAYPASITKILTAIVVLENCEDLGAEIVFGNDAFAKLDKGATTAGFKQGDTVLVIDALKAMLLKSANEAANALAIYVAGSIENFAILMNKKAEEIGALESNFVNPSGLHNKDHYTTAYDMALITRYAIHSELFMNLYNTIAYTLPETSAYPNGQSISIGHKMMHKDNEYYDSRVIMGKTGFTSKAGVTLVTVARDGDSTYVVVLLNDDNPAHYIDTKTLLDYSYETFYNLEANWLFDSKKIKSILEEDGYNVPDGDDLTCEDIYLTLPKDFAVSSVTIKTDYELLGKDIKYLMHLSFLINDVNVGETFVYSKSGEVVKETRDLDKIFILGVIAFSAVVLILILCILKKTSDEEKEIEKKNQEEDNEKLVNEFL